MYYKNRLNLKDLRIKKEIDDCLVENPSYGHKRLSMALGYGKNRILRIMKKFGIKPPRRKIKGKWLTVSIDNCHYTNLIKDIVPVKPDQIFVSDLTYLNYRELEFYLATVEDIFTREVVSFDLSDKHDSTLSFSVIKEAVDKNKPEYFHSDQGTEFMARIVIDYLEQHGVRVSVSDKASPWQNGYKESFFDKFKEENGDLNRFETFGELIEEICSYIYYYNNKRIHTALKMSPIQFKQKLLDEEYLSRKMGT